MTTVNKSWSLITYTVVSSDKFVWLHMQICIRENHKKITSVNIITAYYKDNTSVITMT